MQTVSIEYICWTIIDITLVEEYVATIGVALRLLTEEIFTITPLFRSNILGSNNFVIYLLIAQETLFLYHSIEQ